jgi:hypothetical protein
MMQRGIEFHEMMQTDYPMEFEGKFSTDCILNARNCMDYRSRVFEYKIRRVFRTTFGDIAVTGVADQLIGLDAVYGVSGKFKMIGTSSSYSWLDNRCGNKPIYSLQANTLVNSSQYIVTVIASRIGE